MMIHDCFQLVFQQCTSSQKKVSVIHSLQVFQNHLEFSLNGNFHQNSCYSFMKVKQSYWTQYSKIDFVCWCCKCFACLLSNFFFARYLSAGMQLQMQMRPPDCFLLRKTRIYKISKLKLMREDLTADFKNFLRLKIKILFHESSN
jgi:hypothetical protein